jgi:hypothetical protein
MVWAFEYPRSGASGLMLQMLQKALVESKGIEMTDAVECPSSEFLRQRAG